MMQPDGKVEKSLVRLQVLKQRPRSNTRASLFRPFGKSQILMTRALPTINMQNFPGNKVRPVQIHNRLRNNQYMPVAYGLPSPGLWGDSAQVLERCARSSDKPAWDEHDESP